MIRNLKFHLVIGFTLLLFSCNRPGCENKNSVFNKYTPDTIEYKRELAHQLEANNNDLSYWFDKYERKDDKEYIVVYIQGEKLCAKASILTKDWTKLKGIKDALGKGYEGAKLKGLKFNVQKDAEDIEFVFNYLDQIID